MSENVNEIEIAEKIELTEDEFLSVSRRCRYNKFIADFYDDMAEEYSYAIGNQSDGSFIYAPDESFIK